MAKYSDSNSLNVFEYNDYRTFLKDFFAQMRDMKKAFSLRYFAAVSGFASHSFFSAVIKGKRNLTSQAIHKMITGLKLSGRQAEYFRLMVQYNQAESDEDKNRIFLEMNSIRKFSRYYRLNKKHFDYFSHWYCFPLRELLVLCDWRSDYALLGRCLEPAITAAEAKKGVNILLRAGLVLRNPAGRFELAHNIISTEDIPGHLIRKLRAEFIELSQRASSQIQPSFRDLGSATVALSEASYKKSREILAKARHAILALAETETEADKIYQFHLHVFPLSQTIKSASGKRDSHE